jgi:hypothetical protein
VRIGIDGLGGSHSVKQYADGRLELQTPPYAPEDVPTSGVVQAMQPFIKSVMDCTSAITSN